MEVMSQKNQQPEDWTACDPGDLRAFSRNELVRQARTKWRNWATITGAAGLVLVCFAAFWSVANSGVKDPATERVAWTCRSVFASMDPYFRDEVDAEAQQAIDEHLRRCEHCRRKYEERASELGFELNLAYFQPLLQRSWRIFPLASQ